MITFQFLLVAIAVALATRCRLPDREVAFCWLPQSFATGVGALAGRRAMTRK